jgi:tetrahydromethanopterin S-methyltransferase subunit G
MEARRCITLDNIGVLMGTVIGIVITVIGFIITNR